MKKRLCASLLGMTLLTASLPAMAWAEEPAITVYVDGKQVTFDVEPITEADRTLVPMRAIFEDLGAMVSWDEETQTAAAVRGDVTISFTIDNPIMLKNGIPVTLDVPARKLSDRTLVPLRAVSEALSCRVDWNEETQKVSITTTPGSYRPDDETRPYTLVYGAGDHPTTITEKNGSWTICLPNDWVPELEEETSYLFSKFYHGGIQKLYVQIHPAGETTEAQFREEIDTAYHAQIDRIQRTGGTVASSTAPEPVTVGKNTFLKTQICESFSGNSKLSCQTAYHLLANGYRFTFGYHADTADTGIIDQVIRDSKF